VHLIAETPYSTTLQPSTLLISTTSSIIYYIKNKGFVQKKKKKYSQIHSTLLLPIHDEEARHNFSNQALKNQLFNPDSLQEVQETFVRYVTQSM